MEQPYPKDLESNLRFRIEFHQKCERSDKSKAAALALFEKDIVAFFDLCLWTYDPRKKPPDRPFILYDYQEKYARDINQDIVNQNDALTEKTRDMGATWVTLSVFYYRWMVFDENFLVGSIKEELVDKIGNIKTHFERIRYLLKTTPQWIKDYYGVDKRLMAYMKVWKENGASIVGESMNINFGRQGRFNSILLDEFAFVEQAEAVWTGCQDSSPCLFPISTPHGSMNKFARLKKSGQIKVYTLHWKQHPYKTDDWYAKELTKRTSRDIAQELDINYIVSAGKPYYGGFIRGIHAKKLTSTKHHELLLGWDYGYHHPCCAITQFDAKGRWCILDCILGENELIEDFGEKVKQFLNLDFTGYNMRNYGDPAGEQESDKSKKTSAQILGELGFDVVSVPSNTSLTNYDARKNIIEKKFSTLIDGVPALVVNDIPRTQIIIEAFEGGWHYPEANKHGLVLDKPVREGYYEHAVNALDYIAVNIFSPLKETEDKQPAQSYKVIGEFKDVHYDEEEETPARQKYIKESKGVVLVE